MLPIHVYNDAYHSILLKHLLCMYVPITGININMDDGAVYT